MRPKNTVCHGEKVKTNGRKREHGKNSMQGKGAHLSKENYWEKKKAQKGAKKHMWAYAQEKNETFMF